MSPLAAFALVAAGWLSVRPRACPCRDCRSRSVTLDAIEIAIFTREITVIADGYRLLTCGPVPDREALAATAIEAFESQLRAALRGGSRG